MPWEEALKKSHTFSNPDEGFYMSHKVSLWSRIHTLSHIPTSPFSFLYDQYYQTKKKKDSWGKPEFIISALCTNAWTTNKINHMSVHSVHFTAKTCSRLWALLFVAPAVERESSMCAASRAGQRSQPDCLQAQCGQTEETRESGKHPKEVPQGLLYFSVPVFFFTVTWSVLFELLLHG